MKPCPFDLGIHFMSGYFDRGLIEYDGSKPLPKQWELESWKYLFFTQAREVDNGYLTIECSKACNDAYDVDSICLELGRMAQEGKSAAMLETYAAFALSVLGFDDYCQNDKRSAYEILSILLPNSATCRRLGVELGIITQ